MDFIKVVRLGDKLFCKIKFTNNNLSIVGVDRPSPQGSAYECGQIIDALDNIKEPNPTISKNDLAKFKDIWERYHLNDLQAGTVIQTEYLRSLGEYKGYDWACTELKKAGLYDDGGYIYGSKWLRLDVPEEVINFLKSLPDTDTQPAWI